MEMEDQDSTVRAPLFPAYSTKKKGNEGTQKGDQDWLCNSSYNIGIQELSENETHFEKAKGKGRPKKAKKKKKQKHIVAENHTMPTAESFQVPENDSIFSQLNKKTFIEETGLSFERAFRVDRKGDNENIYYDCLELSKIAKYKLYPKIPVGCDPKEQLLWFESSADNPKKDTSRYFGKKAIKLLTKTAEDIETCLSAESSSSSSAINLNFIPIPQNDCNLANATQDKLKLSFDCVSDSWKSTITKASGSKTVSSSEENKTVDSELQNKTAEFNRKVSESPHDVQLWLDFVDFQEELHSSLKCEANNLFPELYVTEKKIAILDKALKNNPKSVKLHVAKLKLCRDLWNNDKLISCWEELVFYNPNDVELWKEYIFFVLTNLTCFSVPRVLKVFVKCMRTLLNLSEGVITSHRAPPDILDSMLDVFSQLCFILKNCDFVEKAVASFQALIEFNMFSVPVSESHSVYNQIASFEPFWDSGSARFGEDGALGWATTVGERRLYFNTSTTQIDFNIWESQILGQKLSKYETWLKLEQLRQTYLWLPWRPNPELSQTSADIDDIDRAISFEDISKFIFRIPDEQHKFSLLVDFIKFLGFDPHLFGCNFYHSKTMLCRMSVENFYVISKKLNDTLLKEQSSNPLSFKSIVWTKQRRTFVKNVFKQASKKFSTKYRILWSCLWLRCFEKLVLDGDIIVKSYESLIGIRDFDDNVEDIDDVKLLAKGILRDGENRSCLFLWNEFIKIESFCTSKAKAKKRAETLISSASLGVSHGTMPLTELWYFVRSCIDFSLGIQENYVIDSELFSQNEIIWLLICLACKEQYVPCSDPVKSTMILKAISGFKNSLKEEVLLLENKNCALCYCLDPCSYSVIDCAKCFAYFQFFTQGLDAAVQVLKDFYSLIEDKIKDTLKRFILEEICVFQAELFNFQSKNSTTSMKPLLLNLYDSVEHYPNNVRLLYLLVKLRSASSVVSPTRRFFDKILKEPNKIYPTTWIFVLASEISLSYSLSTSKSENTETQFHETPSTTSIIWKIRSMYEKALNSESCAHVPILWRSYMKFEMQNNNVERAESIFHRALQNCGWSKELLMDGVEYFPDDLKQTIDFMVDKQIRLYTTLEEVFLHRNHGFHTINIL